MTDYRLLYILGLCIIVTTLLLAYLPYEEHQHLESFTELDELILEHVQYFTVPARRIRHRSVEVTDDFSRRIFTVDIPKNYPQTIFHKKLHQKLKNFGLDTYATVDFPDKLSTIHVVMHGTVVRTITFRYADENGNRSAN